MSHAFRGFLKKITGEATPDPLNKQPIADADAKLTLFKDVSLITSSAIESYVKSMSKSIDMSLKDKFEESKLEFTKYENKSNEAIETANNILLNTLINKTADLQIMIANEVTELTKNLESKLLKPLQEFQKEVSNVKENRRDLKDAYTKMESCRTSLERAVRDVETSKKQMEQAQFQNDIRRLNEAVKQHNYSLEKKNKYEKELDDARLAVNEKYDRYTEGLFKRVSEETILANCFKNYLKVQNEYHSKVCQHLEEMIPEVEETINNYPKKPIFGVNIEEHLRVSSSINPNSVSPVIRKLIESIIKQNGLNEEGIFRIAGSKSKMNRLIHAINSGYLEYIDFSDYDVHCLASVLKQYLRDLPDSILCNSLYNDWYNAINSSSKIEGYKNVLKKLPKANYENLKYIVKFLSCIIENSERTKMNANNIGICFGMSLLNPSNDDPTLNIDLSTATNAFDFMLSNHHELFPGDINFAQFMPFKPLHYSNTFSGKIKPPISDDNAENNNTAVIRQTHNNVNSSTRQTILSPDVYTNNYNTNNNNNNLPEIKYRHSVMVTDGRYNEHDLNNKQNSTNKISGDNFKGTTNRGHVKTLSSDLNIDEFQKSSSPSPESASNLSVTASPRLRAKKQAPAPPPVALNTSTSSINSTATLNDSFTTAANSNTITNTNTVFPKLPILNDNINSNNNNNNNNITNNNGNGNNNNNNNNNSNKLKQCDSSSNLASSVLEKPSIPPPTVPLRPPPIGFNISLDSKTENNQPPVLSQPLQTNDPVVVVNSPTNTLTKPPKPSIPRKPLNSTISNIINNYNNNNNIKTNQQQLIQTSQQQQQQQKQQEQKEEQQSDDEDTNIEPNTITPTPTPTTTTTLTTNNNETGINTPSSPTMSSSPETTNENVINNKNNKTTSEITSL